jgi:hypothetical protein
MIFLVTFMKKLAKLHQCERRRKMAAGLFFLRASNIFGVLGKNGIILPEAKITKIFCLP